MRTPNLNAGVDRSTAATGAQASVAPAQSISAPSHVAGSANFCFFWCIYHGGNWSDCLRRCFSFTLTPP